ncbi:thioredoxin family protein [Carboxylicivirga taeanensis]|uniref:thioredoxin family protein n=1 Tax=Carboxylicivirga taeanensis TaxID=1416875 RepID=UPI003F6E333C
MKKTVNILVLLLISNLAFSQGIVFFEGTYQEACKKAKQENKNIFVDVYTTWCGPCKKMARDVFTQKVVGDYFNANFVNLKLDAENQADSKFFKHFKASAFPSFFWVTPDSELLDTQSGVLNPEAFVKVAQNALKEMKGQKARLLEERWKNGERSYQLLNEYAFGLLSVTDPKKVTPVATEYVKSLTPEEIRTPQTMSILMRFSRARNGEFPDNYLFKTFVENAEYYGQLTNTSETRLGTYWRKLYGTFVRMPSSLVIKANRAKDDKTKDELMKKFDEAIKQLGDMDFKYKEMFLASIACEKLLYTGNYADGISEVADVLDKYGSDYPFLYSELLYSISFSEYFLKGNKVKGEELLAIAKECLKKTPSKASVMYYAMAQNNLNNVKEALEALTFMHEYPDPQLSKRYYQYFGIGNFKAKFPY